MNNIKDFPKTPDNVIIAFPLGIRLLGNGLVTGMKTYCNLKINNL